MLWRSQAEPTLQINKHSANSILYIISETLGRNRTAERLNKCLLVMPGLG